MLLLWRNSSAGCGHIFPASCELDLTCQNGVVGRGRLELVHITQWFYFGYWATHAKLAATVWRPWIRSHPTCFSRASAAGLRGKAKVATSVTASMLRANTDVLGNAKAYPHSKIRHFVVALLIPYHTHFTHNVKELLESLSSTAKFGLSFPH